jgi:hypothetical protein
MPHQIRVEEVSTLGKGKHFRVSVADHVVGRIEQNPRGLWCYFSGSNELNPELSDPDFGTLRRMVMEKLGYH